MSDIDNGVCAACVGTGVIWEISVLPSQFGFKPKTNLKKLNSSTELFKNLKVFHFSITDMHKMQSKATLNSSSLIFQGDFDHTCFYFDWQQKVYIGCLHFHFLIDHLWMPIDFVP